MTKKKKYTYALIISGIVILVWFLDNLRIGTSFEIRVFPVLLAQIFAQIGITFMGLNFILASRIRPLEQYFGGLDKMYRLHQYFGRTGFVLILFHPILLLLGRFYSIDSILLYFFPGSLLKYNLGMLAYYIFITSILLTIVAKLPYHIWKFFHRFMIVAFVIGATHASLTAIDKGYFFVDVFLGILTTIAVVCYVYYEFLYQKIGPVFYYKIISKNILGAITEIKFAHKDQNKKLSHKAGQFMFFEFLKHKEIKSELHPFTISSAPSDEYIRVSAKNLGDYTSTLVSANIGDEVKLIGPYGLFTREKYLDYKNQIWISGGIGLTPFLSMVKDEANNPSGNKIIYYYCIDSRENDVYANEIKESASKLPLLKLITHYDKEQGFFKAEETKSENLDYSTLLVKICGPTVMMITLEKQFLALGVKQENIIYEDFALK